jgi:hypothetical protein
MGVLTQNICTQMGFHTQKERFYLISKLVPKPA